MGVETELKISKVFDSGEVRGIVCCIMGWNNEAVVVSLTHLSE